MHEAIQTILGKLSSVRESGQGRWQCQCPAHEDNRASLSVTADSGKVLLHCHAGCSAQDVLGKIGLTFADLKGKQADEPIEYKYHDEQGNHVYSALRYPDKQFRQRQANGTWTMKGVTRYPYNLPAVLKADRVFIVEGEKDVETLRRAGLIATTNIGGAGKWQSDWKDYFAGKTVYILPDNDQPGADHAIDVQSKLGHGTIIELPGLPPKGDVSDWIQSGGTAAKLEDLAQSWDRTSKNSGKSEVSVLALSDRTSKLAIPDLTEFRPFPTECLPGPLSEYVKQVALSVCCDESFAALPLLSGLAACVGNSLNLRIKKAWRVPAILWCAVVAPSGSAKSVPPKQALRPIYARQSKLIKQFDKDFTEYLQQHEVYLKQLSEFKKSKSTTELPPAQPVEPVCPRIVVNDTTIEALGKRLSDNPRGVLALYDELAGWLGAFNRYSKGSSDESKWLEFYSAQTSIIDRSTAKRPLIVERANVSLFGTIQPGILRKHLTADYRASGLAARLLFSMPPRQQKTWSEHEVEDSLEEKLVSIFDKLLSIEMQRTDDELRPALIDLDSHAKDLFVRYYDRHNREQQSLDEDLYAAYSKLEEVAARIALVIHAVRYAVGEINSLYSLDISSMAAGIELCEWFKHEAKRVYAVLSENQITSDNRQLIQWISSQNHAVTTRDFYRANKAKFASIDEAERMLQSFVDAELGRWINAGPGEQGGRPTRRFELFDSSAKTETPVFPMKQGGFGTEAEGFQALGVPWQS